MKCWIIRSKNSAVFIGTKSGLFFDYSYIVVFDNKDCNCVLLTGYNQIRDIKFTPDKSSFNSSLLFTIYINIRFPVYAVKIQQHCFTCKIRRHIKLVAIPEVGPEE